VLNSRADGTPRRGRRKLVTRHILRFRGYPHLDRAYRLMKQGKVQDATDELASYLRRDPYDVAARQTYLILLYEQGRYAETACEATSLLKDESQNASVLVYRALAEQRLGQTAQALMDFRDAAANVSAPRAERVFAANSEIDLLIHTGNFAEAQKAVEGIAREADDFAFYYRKGMVADALGHDVDAQSAYQAAINKAIKDYGPCDSIGGGGTGSNAPESLDRGHGPAACRARNRTPQHRLDTRTRRS